MHMSNLDFLMVNGYHAKVKILYFSVLLFGEGNGNPLVFLPGEVHGQRSLVGYSPQSHKQSYTTERLNNILPLHLVLQIKYYITVSAILM